MKGKKISAKMYENNGYEGDGETVGGYVFVEKVAVVGTNEYKLQYSLYAYSLTGEAITYEFPIYADFYMVDFDTNGDEIRVYVDQIIEFDTYLPKNDANPEANLIARCESITLTSDEYGDFELGENFNWQYLAILFGDDDCGGVIDLEYYGENGTCLQDELPIIYDETSDIYAAQSTGIMGEDLLLSLVRDSYSYTHELYYEFFGVKEKIADGVTNNYTWKIPDLAAVCDNALSGVCRIWCYTYDGDNFYGNSYIDIVLTVPDATVPSVKEGKIVLGTQCTILCPRNSDNFTVKLELVLQNNNVELHTGNINSFDCTPKYRYAKYFKTQTSIDGTLKCTTYNGTAKVGEENCIVKVSVPENDITRPQFTAADLKLSPISGLPKVFDGIYIRGKTGIQAEMSADSNCSEISSYILVVGSQSAEGNPASINLLISEGNEVKVTAKVTDARGYSTTVTTSINVLPYQNPRVIPCDGQSSVICERATENGGLSPNGTYLAINAGKRFSSVKLNGEEQNSCILRYHYKPNGGEYGEWFTLLEADSKASTVEKLIGNVVSSLQTSYMVEIEAADALGGVHTLTFQIMTAAISFVLFDGPDGAGFGKYPEAEHVVDIASHMTLLCRGKLVVVSAAWTDLGLADGISEAVYSYGKKQESGCHWNVANGNHVYVAFDCTFEYSGTRKVINRTAIPEEYRPHRETYVLCPVSNQGIALVSVNTDGYVWVEWVLNLADMARSTTVAVEWIDGYLDYWT